MTTGSSTKFQNRGQEVNEWQSYEELVKDIYQALGKAAGVIIECWGPSCKVQGKSGVCHQIDVLTSHSDGIHTYRTAIECKDWNTEKVSKDPVMKLSEILDDANIEKGVLVSKAGFTPDAEKMAESKGICLIQLRKPEVSDWDGYIKEIPIEFCLFIDEVYDYEAGLKNVDESQQSSFRDAGIELRVGIESGDAMSFREIADRVRKLPEHKEEGIDEDGFWWTVTSSVNDEDVRAYVVTFPDGTIVTHPTTGHQGNISELRFKVRQIMQKIEIHIDHEDYVAWIMKFVFEDKMYAISPDRIPTRWQ